jgi:hypothetical protein
MAKRTLKKNKQKRALKQSFKKHQKGGKRPKKKTKKKQKGGSVVAAAGIGSTLLSGMAMAAYAGFKLINRVTDKTIVQNLLDSVAIEYLPSIEVLKDKKLMEHYLQCVTKVQLFSLILKQKDLLRSRNLTRIIEDVTQTDKHISDLKEAFESFDKDIQESYYSNDDLLPVTVKPSRKYRDGPLHDLSNFIFETSEIFGKQIPIAIKNTSWYDVIMTGQFGENKQFEIDVDELLKERKSFQFIDKLEINTYLQKHKDNSHFRDSIFKKMLECCSKSRGISDYIRGDISFDSNKGCIQCPDEDCLIYIYEFYYEYLLEENDIPTVNKIYMLSLCEARMCILSKCICLEAIRIQDERLGKVEDLLFKIYELDESRNQLYTLPKDVVSGVVNSEPFRKYSMKGGADNTSPPVEEDTPLEVPLDEPIESGGVVADESGADPPTEVGIESGSLETTEQESAAEPVTDMGSSLEASEDPFADTTATTAEPASEDPFADTTATTATNAEPASEDPFADTTSTPAEPASEDPFADTTSATAEPASEDPFADTTATPAEPASEDPFADTTATPAEPASEDPFGDTTATPAEPASEDPFADTTSATAEPESTDSAGEVSSSGEVGDEIQDVVEPKVDSELDSELDVDGILSEIKKDKDKVEIKKNYERIMIHNIRETLGDKTREEIIDLMFSLEKLIEDLRKKVNTMDREIFDISESKDKDTLISEYVNRMETFAFEILSKVLINHQLLASKTISDISDFMEMYQYDVRLFDYLTPDILLSEVFSEDTDDTRVSGQKEALDQIEAKLLEENIGSDNCILLASVAYMHPAVLEMNQISSITDEKLKSKLLTSIKKLVFSNMKLDYNKSELLERLMKIIVKLENRDKLLFKEEILRMTMEEKEDFKELHDMMIELEIRPSELVVENYDASSDSKKSEKTTYCKKLDKDLLEKLKNKEPIIFNERMALIYNMCQKGDYDETIQTLSKLPDMLETIQKEEVERKSLLDDFNSDKKNILSKEEELKDDYEEQLSLIR